jgi:hypothetical protein
VADNLRTPPPSDPPVSDVQRWFQDYIFGRAQVVRFFAIVLAVALLAGVSWLVSDTQNHIYQFGVLLQLFGTTALVPYVITKGDPSNLLQAAVPAGNGLNETVLPGYFVTEIDYIRYYRAHNQQVVIGNGLASLVFMLLMAEWLIFPPQVLQPVDLLSRGVLALMGFTWLNLFMLVHIFVVMQARIPQVLVAWFFLIDLVVSIFGGLFACLVEIFLHWIPRGFHYAYQNGYRRVLLVFTLPCFVVGLLFELVASF